MYFVPAFFECKVTGRAKLSFKGIVAKFIEETTCILFLIYLKIKISMIFIYYLIDCDAEEYYGNKASEKIRAENGNCR